MHDALAVYNHNNNYHDIVYPDRQPHACMGKFKADSVLIHSADHISCCIESDVINSVIIIILLLSVDFSCDYKTLSTVSILSHIAIQH